MTIQRLRFAYYGRVSTEDNQDPTLSLPRQLIACQDGVARIGGEIVAYYYDIESGGLGFNARGSGKAVSAFDIPIRRDGGLQDLLEEARYGRFDTVVCESINRFARNPSVTFQAEEELRIANVKLWAVDEPWEESFGSIVLRHVNVGLARGYVHELKVKSRKGIETAAKQGRHPGGQALYGYRFKELPHPNPHKASQGLRMRILEPDPVRAPVVTMVFQDYLTRGLSITEICAKLNADLDRFPPPESPDPKRRTGRWGRSSVWEILHNPKYTGFQVWNRRQRKRGGKVNPPEDWIWSDAVAHEPLVSRTMFDEVILAAGRRDNSGRKGGRDSVSKFNFPLKSFVRCGICGLRMQGNNRSGVHYYKCVASHRQPTLVPEGHPPTVCVREDWAAERVLMFMNDHLFGPKRIALLHDQFDSRDPALEESADEVARLKAEVSELEVKVRRQLANLEAEEPTSPLAIEVRKRLSELASLKQKREEQLRAAERTVPRKSSLKNAENILNTLPLTEVDWKSVSEQDFRELLAALNFQASYDPAKKELTVAVTLAPDLVLEDDPTRVCVLYVPPGGELNKTPEAKKGSSGS